MNKTISDNLETLIYDCRAQLQCLKMRNDVAWDCYDANNWNNMIILLEEIKEALNEQ